MNKANNERIEMIKTNGIITMSNVHRVISKQNLDFLIEQAERAQELEVALQKVTSSWSKKVEENKRYREALEFYADKDNYKLEHFDPNLDDYMSTVDYDEGETARKALEGESE